MEGEERAYDGLSKEELIHYSNDPFWIRLRWSLLVLFWVFWLAMLASAILIIIFASKCPSLEPREWWQKGPVYRVDVKRFQDSNSDGVGDLAGLESELDYVVEAGMNTVLLSSFYKSPGKARDNYDISDYQDVDSTVGSLTSWRSLLAAAKSRNLKVLVDLVPNHSSDQHEWFVKSAGRVAGYEDYYVWKSGPSPPNAWKSTDGGPGWTRHAERGEWYLHNYGPNQPDLNLDNPKVVEELQAVMEFWLKEGVDGFNVDSVNLLMEDFTLNRGNKEKNKAVVRKLREVVDRATAKDGLTKVLISLTGLPLPDFTYLYGDNIGENGGDLLHLPVGEPLLQGVSSPLNATSLKDALDTYMRNLPTLAWPAFSLSPSPATRVARRQAADLLDPLNMLTLLLPGTPLPLFGDELGQTGESLDWNLVAKYKAGRTGGQATRLSVYTELAKLRTQEALLLGSSNSYTFNSTFVLTRVKKGNPCYLLAINFATTEQTLNVTSLPNMADNVKVVVSSTGGDGMLSVSQETVKQFPAKEVKVGPRQAKVFTFQPTF